jgi:hypothetical protein
LEPELTTYVKFVVGLTAMEDGARPTYTLFVITLLFVPSITEAVLEPELVTYTLLVFGLTAIEKG